MASSLVGYKALSERLQLQEASRAVFARICSYMALCNTRVCTYPNCQGVYRTKIYTANSRLLFVPTRELGLLSPSGRYQNELLGNKKNRPLDRPFFLRASSEEGASIA